MSTYIIGDIHGYATTLENLLLKINFSSQDILWFTGDLVNGGDQPVETIRLIKSLDKQAICVLGNHDLMLLACAHNKKLLDLMVNGTHNKDHERVNGFIPVFNAIDQLDLLNWLEHRPLAHFDPLFNILLVHAGVHPLWTVKKTINLAGEVEKVLSGAEAINLYNKYDDLYNNNQNNIQDNWHDQLTGIDRIRCIINYLTRMRFCTITGKLNFHNKGTAKQVSANSEFIPWFEIVDRKTKDVTIAFGHWAALNGSINVKQHNVIALDTGCGWGKKLTAYRVEDQSFFAVNSG